MKWRWDGRRVAGDEAGSSTEELMAASSKLVARVTSRASMQRGPRCFDR